MYNKVNTNMNFVDRERETLKFWNENHPSIFLESTSVDCGTGATPIFVCGQLLAGSLPPCSTREEQIWLHIGICFLFSSTFTFYCFCIFLVR